MPAQKYHAVAIIGVNQESAHIFSCLCRTEELKIVKILNPETEPLVLLRRVGELDIIIDTTYDDKIQEKIQELRLKDVDVISGLSARMLFCSGKDTSNGTVAPNDYRIKVLDSLGEIQRTMHLARDKEQLLKLILNISLQAINADTGSIMLVDPEKHSLRLESADGLENAIVGTTLQKLGKGVAGRVVKTKQPVLTTGPVIRTGADTVRLRADIVSSICCPLLIGDEVIGVLNINSKTPSRIFDQTDLHYVKKLAEFTAGIVQTSHSYSTTTRTTYSLSLVNNLREILNLDYPFNERMNLACMKLANTMQAEVCKYYEYDTQSGIFLTRASSVLDLNLLKGKVVQLNARTTKLVLEQEGAVTLKTIMGNGENRWYGAQRVTVNGRLIGLLVVQTVNSRDDMNDELKVLEKIAVVLAKDYLNHQTIQASRVQAIKFSVISELAYNFANVTDLPHLGTMIVSNACLIMEAESCILRVVKKQSLEMMVYDSFSYRPASHLRKVEALDAIVSDELTGGQPLIHIPDLRASMFDTKEAHCCESVLSMGFVIHDRLSATLSLYDKRPGSIHESGSFSVTDKDIFLNYCLQASKALQRFL